MPARVRSLKEARRLVESVAVQIASAPRDTARVAGWLNAARQSLGRQPVPEEAVGAASCVLMETRLGEREARVPLAMPTPLDEGGMNQVLRTWELFAGREVAVRKHLPAESAIAASLREARDRVIDRRLSRLPRHPVIQRFWATGSLQGERCELFDFAPGSNLLRYVARNGLTYGALLDLALHTARGLSHLHAHDLMHGDIKPENLCVDERRRAAGGTTLHVSIIDFDIVSTPEEQVQQYLLGNGLEGTLAYMPPENFGQDAPADPGEARRMIFAKDVYALGLTLYRVLSGDVPENFQTGEHELLLKKMAHEEAHLDFAPAVPESVRSLVRRMTAADWTLRPDLAGVIREVRLLREAAREDARARLLVRGSLTPVPPRAPRPPAADLVGPYRVVNRSFAPRLAEPGQTLPLAELQDPLGRRLVGVPYAFETEAEEVAFYAERGRLLSDLNLVRLRHHELFPGSFRDLVRTKQDGRHLVWILRPLLVDAIDLDRYLGEERPQASTRERIAILRRIAEGLAALEEAGYTLPRLTPERVFFIPQAAEVFTATKALLTRPVQKIFDVPGKEPGRVFRQELMGTASARRVVPGEAADAVADFIELARRTGVSKALMGRVNLAAAFASASTWAERVEILRQQEDA